MYSSLSEELHLQRSPPSVLGPLPVPPKVLSAQNSHSCASCSREDPVCSVEGGIKFNPCYNNSENNDRNNNNSNTLCDVMLDAVWHAGHSAAVHAGRAN